MLILTPFLQFIGVDIKKHGQLMAILFFLYILEAETEEIRRGDVEVNSSDTDDGYLDFSLHMGYVIGVIGLFCAFTFTLICLIIAEIADPSIFQIQVILLLLSLLFYVSLYLLADSLAMDLHYCGRLPPLVGTYKTFEYGVFALFYMFGLVVPLIFFSWSLFAIGLGVVVMYAVFSIMAVQFIIRPLLKFRRPQDLK